MCFQAPLLLVVLILAVKGLGDVPTEMMHDIEPLTAGIGLRCFFNASAHPSGALRKGHFMGCKVQGRQKCRMQAVKWVVAKSQGDKAASSAGK